MNWISIEDEKPKLCPEYCDVLCKSPNGRYFIAYNLPFENAVIGNRININGAGWRPFTHWLPLPRKDKNKVTK